MADEIATDQDARQALQALADFAEMNGYDGLRGTINALSRLFAVRTEAFQDLAMYGAKVRIHLPGDDDPDDLVAHKAIVFEPGVGEAPTGTYWDPNQGEYTTPQDYPMGTINAIRAPDGEDLLDDYISDVVIETSITPAEDPTDPGRYTYTSGWG